MHFNPPQILCINKIFSQAESLVGRYFRMSYEDLKANRYDVKTLVHLQDHELDTGAFAHLCKYYYEKNRGACHPEKFHFYRICLQDDRILDALKRATSFIKFSPLLLYIAAHELVHVIRFNRGDGNFDADAESKRAEEEKVHVLTRHVLQSVAGQDMTLVMDCFSDHYRIGDIL